MLFDHPLHKSEPVIKTAAVYRAIKNWQLLSSLIIVCSILLLTNMASAQQKAESPFAAATGKKLIEYGWDQFYAADPAFIRDHIHEMEKQPFEGIAFRLPDHDSDIFAVSGWKADKAAEQKQVQVLSSIKWDKFTDNFLTIYAASTMDWYSDTDWDKILYKVRYNADAAVAAGCVGIVFDPESYGGSPWKYSAQVQAKKYTFAQYSEKAYQRGQQFMQVMQSEMPNVKLLMFVQYSMFYYSSHNPDPAKRMAGIEQHSYGLMLPFLNGMLSEAGPKVQLIDGNEGSYYYTAPEDFYRAYWRMRQGARINVPDALKTKFDSHVRAGQALYVDHLFALRSKPNVSAGMTPEERAKWFEQNVYYALQTSDEYVWLYNEQMDWFNHPVLPGDSDRMKAWKSQPPPPGLVDAIKSAKTKLQNGQSLGYSMDAIFTKAQAKLKQKMLQRSATIPRLSEQQIPHIDGVLNEKIYQQIPWLQDFVGYFQTSKPPIAATQAFAAYDDKDLFVAFRCDEPDLAKQQVIGKDHDSNVWAGESVEISVLKPGEATDNANAAYYHFILNPSNIHWDGVSTGANSDMEYNPNWQSATAKTTTGWTAEIAIPWKALGVDDVHSGLQIHANLARQRLSDETEFSSWSQFVSGFQEPQHFGTWTLAK